MAVRLATLLPRAVVAALVWVLATAAFTFAADTTIIGPSSATSNSALSSRASRRLSSDAAIATARIVPAVADRRAAML